MAPVAWFNALFNALGSLSIMFSKNIRDLIMVNNRAEQASNDDDVLAEIKRQLAHIRYGSLEIQIHNGQIVQIESREKKRWGRSENAK